MDSNNNWTLCASLKGTIWQLRINLILLYLSKKKNQECNQVGKQQECEHKTQACFLWCYSLVHCGISSYCDENRCITNVIIFRWTFCQKRSIARNLRKQKVNFMNRLMTSHDDLMRFSLYNSCTFFNDSDYSFVKKNLVTKKGKSNLESTLVSVNISIFAF